MSELGPAIEQAIGDAIDRAVGEHEKGLVTKWGWSPSTLMGNAGCGR